MGREKGLSEDWVNSEVKRTLSRVKIDNSKMIKLFSSTGITCYVVPPEMLLATKSMIVMRDSPKDRDDIMTMCRVLGVKTGEDIQKVVKEFYPNQKGFMDYQIEYFEELAEASQEQNI